MVPLGLVSVLIEGLDHPEGVAFGPDGCVYAGGEAGQIYRIDKHGKSEVIASTGGFILGLCLDAECNVYACDAKSKALFRISPTGDTTLFSKGCSQRPMVTPNFPAFDAQGYLYVADSGDWHRNNGVIYRIGPDGETHVASEVASQFPNGLALNDKGDQLYVALSNVPGIVSLEVYDDGRLGIPKPVVELPRAIPDGLAFDIAGNLFVGCYTPDVVYKLSPDRRLSIFLEDWESTVLSSPTNIAFGGPQLSTMLLASLGRWHLAKLQADVPGLPLRYPKLSAAS